MKKILIAFVAALLAAPFSQAVELVSGDKSNLTELCIAAAQSDEMLRLTVRQYGFSQTELDSFTCNGMTLEEFADAYRNNDSGKPVMVYTFEVAEDSRESQLCVAAATSNEAYMEAKERLYDGKVGDIACNGLPIERFAKRYGNKGFRK
ncbi:hypothetical protein [Alteromonas sp. CYL-A6]|uniref:hypothetical protein n=1 Tax=Alteromonas nitratireducens TaxID=3390813 RepID=UPI0034AE1EDA